MKIINDTSFDLVTDENIRDFVKYYGIITVNDDDLLELKLNFDDLPYNRQLALVRYEDEEYEYTILEHYFDRLDKSSLVLLLNGITHDDLAESKSTLKADINYLAVELYRESCQDVIDYWCTKISEEEQNNLNEGLKYA